MSRDTLLSFSSHKNEKRLRNCVVEMMKLLTCVSVRRTGSALTSAGGREPMDAKTSGRLAAFVVDARRQTRGGSRGLHAARLDARATSPPNATRA